jgi:hypothetical protein
VRALLALSCVAVALTAVAHGAATPGGYRTHTVPGYGISLSLPSSWRAVDSHHVLTAAQVQALAKDNPELVGALSAIRNRSSPIKFFAFDPIPTRRFATNVNVVVEPVAVKIGFDDYAKALVAELSSLSSISGLRATRTRLPAGEAVRVSYRLRFRANGRTFTTATLQYAFLRAMRSIVFTYTTLPELQPLYASVFARSATSIAFSG